MESASWSERLQRRAARPVDIASLAALRILFGTLMGASTLRFLLSGWVPVLFEQPRFFFKYAGFAWVQPWPAWGMRAHYAVLVVLALCVALGLFYRLAIVLFTVGFAYAQLIDVTNYLNHYYLVVLLGGLLCCMPAHRAWSLDAWRRPALRRAVVPWWCIALLRFQVAVVYFYAGIAKFNSDWLLHAQPLQIWLKARDETPFIGSWLNQLWLAYAMSWFAFAFDSTIWLWLSLRRTRPWAYALVVVFHVFTYVFFDIGMFPFIMVTTALVFFPPAWPRHLPWLRAMPPPVLQSGSLTKLPRWAIPSVLAYCSLQLALPLRNFLYPGNVLWHEQGMRYAWKVLVREKNGSVAYAVRQKSTGRVWQVSPYRYLRWRQVKELNGQPDLILQLAHHIAAGMRQRGVGDVEVRAEALVSLNGRPALAMIDASVDLTQVRDGLAPATYVLPAPSQPPRRLLSR